MIADPDRPRRVLAAREALLDHGTIDQALALLDSAHARTALHHVEALCGVRLQGGDLPCLIATLRQNRRTFGGGHRNPPRPDAPAPGPEVDDPFAFMPEVAS